MIKVANDIRHCVARLVTTYAVFKKLDNTYSLSINDLPDFEIHELTSLFLADDDLASEANGPDNPEYEKSMLPSLVKYMRNTSDRDEEYEFTRAWREGVASYFKDNIQKLIDEQCDNYMSDTMNNHGLYAHRRFDNGEIIWRGYL